VIDNINAVPDYGDEPPFACSTVAVVDGDAYACSGTPGHAGKHTFPVSRDNEAPESAAVTPGQAAEIPAAFGGWVRMQFPREIELPKNEIAGRWKYMTGPAEREFWREVETALAARQPQPAPGVTVEALAAALADTRPPVIIRGIAEPHTLARPYDLAVQVIAALGEQPAPELAAAPELRAAMRETSKVQDVVARMLSWFGGDGTRRHASATRAQLAHAYRDGGLTVPEELRRFL
jgi:hypothetical protein